MHRKTEGANNNNNYNNDNKNKEDTVSKCMW